MSKIFILCVAALITAAACGGGGGDGSPTSPSPAPSTGATITITSSGVSPRTVTVAAGSRVTFVNSSARAVEISSNPHPEHTDCQAINDVGFLQPNQSRLT